MEGTISRDVWREPDGWVGMVDRVVGCKGGSLELV